MQNESDMPVIYWFNKNLTSKENIIPGTVLSEAKTSTDINTSWFSLYSMRS